MFPGSATITHPSLPVRRRRRRGGALAPAANHGFLRVDFEAPLRHSWRSTGRRDSDREAVDVAGVTLSPSAPWQIIGMRSLIGQ